MANDISREAYFQAGLDVLADLGYGGLKLAEVCNRLGVTTGSFYHYFSSWPSYTRALVEHWKDASTTRLVDRIRGETDPRRRIGTIIEIGLNLPHSAEAAIRAWSSADPEVHALQVEVDKQRHDITRESALQILRDERQAELFANWAVYLLVGYEQATLQPDKPALEWIVAQLLDALDTGRFATVSADRPAHDRHERDRSAWPAT
jgi:AcrR family transcriptional regulator